MRGKKCVDSRYAGYGAVRILERGICADGFGWGHGRQTYNNGYPSDGVLAALDILKAAKGTPWEREIERIDFSWVFHYLHGITWSDYKDASVPMQSRHAF